MSLVVTRCTKSSTLCFSSSNIICNLFLIVGYNNKMNVQLAAHPHLYHLITWFEKEELLVQQLEMKVISDVSVHKRKRAPTIILIDESLQSLWASYKSGIITPKRLLLESSKWVA